MIPKDSPYWYPGQSAPDVNDDLMTLWCAAIFQVPRLTGPEAKATLAQLVSHLSGGKQKVVDTMTKDTDWRPTPCPTCGAMRPAAASPVCMICGGRQDDLKGLGDREARPAPPRVQIEYDFETLRAKASQHNDRHSWSRYHHALQSAYESGALVKVEQGTPPEAVPEVVFTDGVGVVTMGKVPDQFVRFVREDRRYPPVQPRYDRLLGALRALVADRDMLDADEVRDLIAKEGNR